jgi:lipopolysaccharide export system permease protein
MRILTRYVLIEFTKTFAVTLGGLTLLMIIVGVAREAYDKGLGIAQVLQLVPFILPDAMRYTVPGTVLFAACLVYGRMSGGNEITAIKSLGISPNVLIAPVVVLVFLISLATVALNDLAVTWGHEGVRRVVLESIDDIAYSMLRVQRSYSTDQFSINVKRVEGRTLIQPTITFAGKDKAPNVTVRAAEAEMRSDPKQDILIMTCREAEIDVEGSATARLDVLVREFPLDGVDRSMDTAWSPSFMSQPVIKQRTAKQTREIEQVAREMAALTAFQLIGGDFDGLASRERAGELEQYKFLTFILTRLRCEPHRRWSSGFSCLCFLLVGVPMAIRLRNADLLTSFFMCFLPILVVYYPLFIWGVDRAKAGDMPPITVWLGNAMLVLWGLWLLRRVRRY